MRNLKVHMSVGPDKIHLWLPREVKEEVAKPPSIIFEFPLMKKREA